MSLKYFELGDSPNPYWPGPRGSAAACQIPEMSGLPFTRGTAPVIFTLPSGVRGAPGVGRLSHWAWAHKQVPTNAIPIHIGPCMLSIKLQARSPFSVSAKTRRRREQKTSSGKVAMCSAACNDSPLLTIGGQAVLMWSSRWFRLLRRATD
jgi:hypothetical protein